MRDTISRQDAIDAVDDQIKYCDKALASFSISSDVVYAVKVEKASLNALKETLENLPSAQPEIIRCKDCKHSEHWYRDKARCFLWREEGIDVFEDGFCSYAERKTDG